jgi:hypothetical protein
MDAASLEKILTADFDKLDEEELAYILAQAGRRMAVLRCTTPDMPFWHTVLSRVCKWLSADPTLTEAEKKLLHNPPEKVSGRARSVMRLRDRTGMNMATCMKLIDTYIHDNIDTIHPTVKVSYFSREENRKAHGLV